MPRIFPALLVFALSCSPVHAGELIVSAAASLTNAFRDLGKSYEDAHPGDRITFNFAASDVLLSQIANGAPVDIFASADKETMDRAETQSLLAAGSRRVLLTNSLVLIVPVGSKAALTGLAGLDRPAIRRIAIGDPASVPAGRYARKALEQAQLWSKLEPRYVLALNVRQCLDYVARAEADAGLVYATDAAIMPDKVRVAATVPTLKPIVYPIALIKGTKNPALAESFLIYLSSGSSRAVFKRYGFGQP
jgi:molybdate transport system substrate-binding protein